MAWTGTATPNRSTCQRVNYLTHEADSRSIALTCTKDVTALISAGTPKMLTFSYNTFVPTDKLRDLRSSGMLCSADW
jgi:hypothetical protein